MSKNPTYKTYGNKAILIEWQPIIDDAILKDIINFKEKIMYENTTNFADLIIGYHSLTIIYKNEIVNFTKEFELLKSIYKKDLKVKKQQFYTWQIPVCYDVSFGIDLQEISQKLNVTIDEIITLHSTTIYKVYFIGFLPGFLYLGGLNEQLYFNRKSNPRLNVAKGSVGIGGKQTGIYPENSAGGWNIIGKTPIHFFDVEKVNPSFAKAGDAIQFIPISLEVFHQLDNNIQQKDYKLIKTLQDD